MMSYSSVSVDKLTKFALCINHPKHSRSVYRSFMHGPLDCLCMNGENGSWCYDCVGTSFTVGDVRCVCGLSVCGFYDNAPLLSVQFTLTCIYQ